MAKTLVLYAFFELNSSVEHFINHCIFYDPNIDFIMISSNMENIFTVPSYVKVLMRENKGYDFGSWSDALLNNNLYKDYDYFIFLNASAKGPYLPLYFKDKWTDIYINGLQGNVKLFGSTINTMGKPLTNSHIQSYIFSMDKDTLQYLIDCDIFSKKYVDTKGEAIENKEIGMSRKIIENGWNIGSLLKCYYNVDFTFSSKTPESYGIQYYDDLMWSWGRGILWNDEEVVFIKGNRLKGNDILYCK